MARLIRAIAYLLCITLVVGCSINAGPVYIEDISLEQLVRELTGLDDQELTADVLKGITYLDAQGRGITSLEGIQMFENLQELNLQDNAIEDISALASLTQLRILDLRNNNVTDVSSLANLRSIEDLDLRGNAIEDISPLSSLKLLTELNLRDNEIYDLTPLADLIRIRELNIRGNNISDISVLANKMLLQDLNIRDNNISDISPLAELPNLTHRLYLQGNPISSFLPLREIYGAVAETDFTVNVGFTVAGGFHAEAVAVELFTFVQGGVIYYTLDGSLPDPVNNKKSTYMYQGPIIVEDRSKEPNLLSTIRTTYHNWPGPPKGVVFKGTPIRAVVYLEEEPVGSAAQTYFVGSKEYSMPIISLVTDAHGLFDEKTGIYIPGNRHREGNLWTGNYFARGIDWEREGHLEFYETDGSLALSQNIGMRIHGGITRAWPQKTLRLYARSEYGESRFNYQIFPNQDQQSYKRLLLRGSGNDMRLTLFRDAFIQSLLTDTTNLDTQAYRPAIVFINGEYWGIHNIRERLDKHYIADKYDIDSEDVVILALNAYLNEGVSGDQRHYRDMLSFIRTNDISKPDVYAKVNTMMDIDNYIDYQIAQIYAANTDWPFNNIKFWRARTDEYLPDAPYGQDGRWRWLVYDMDYGFGLAESPDHNTLKWATEPGKWSTELLRMLLKNPEFKNQFISRFADHINTTFAPERAVPIIDEMQAVLAPEWTEHAQRWPYTISTWDRNVNVMKSFAKGRPQYMFKHITDMFKLPGTAQVQVSASEGGSVQVNGIQVDMSFAGTYFKTVPVEIEAIPEPGYEFVGWTGSIQSESTQIHWTPGSNITLEAVFQPQG